MRWRCHKGFTMTFLRIWSHLISVLIGRNLSPLLCVLFCMSNFLWLLMGDAWCMVLDEDEIQVEFHMVIYLNMVRMVLYWENKTISYIKKSKGMKSRERRYLFILWILPVYILTVSAYNCSLQVEFSSNAHQIFLQCMPLYV